jgi:hypothetical protein
MELEAFRKQQEREEEFFKHWNNWSLVEPCIKEALAKVEALDFGLLEDRTGERSIAHRIAVYLEKLFREWHVDCEFNRQGDVGGRTTKRVSANETLPESREGQGSVDVTPDIIVHLRRTRRNLLAIEVKPSHSTELPKDREKLRRYLTESHLKYSFAVLVTYHNGRAEFAPIERVEAR